MPNQYQYQTDDPWIQFGQQAFGTIDGINSENYQNGAIDQVLGLNAPTLTPVQAEQQQASGMAGVQADPAARAAQQQALASLMQSGTDGYGIEDRAATNNALAETNANAAGRAGALQNQMQARGMGGSGFALAAQLANNQNAAQTSSLAGMNAAAGSRQRALQAMQAGGSLASNIRGQSFDEGAKKAAAQDDINARNAAMRQQANLYNSGLQQTGFEDQAQVAGMKSGALQNAAQASQGRQRDKMSQAMAMQQGLMQGMSAIPGAVTGMGGMGGGGGGSKGGGGISYSQAPQMIDMNTPDEQWRY